MAVFRILIVEDHQDFRESLKEVLTGRLPQAEVDEADLNAEIETTLGLVEPHLKGGISLERDFGDLPRVRCLPGQLNQVFMNLLMNARDALEGKGRILVRTRTSEMGVALFFENDGPGIPEEVHGRMFHTTCNSPSGRPI